MTGALPDAAARAAAIDPRISVCVSAPAGSGKTGLLVRRFLTLLARVDAPESVVAITFTRKAAAEMRARVLEALQAAARGDTGADEHAQGLLQAARAAGERSAAAGWDLVGHPARLSIQTIDSFCGELTRQMPVLSGCGGPITAADDADDLCRVAVERFLRRELESGRPEERADLERLLLHLDNRWDSVSQLLVRLLQRREQWQPVFGATGLGDHERPVLIETLAELVRFRIASLRADLAPWLPALREAFAWRERAAPGMPGFDPDSDELAAWRPLATLCLTSAGEWRKTVTVKQGFPAGKGEAAEQKRAFLELLGEWREGDTDALRDALRDLLLLPDPDGAEEGDHWAVLAGLTRLLPRLVAQLLLVFRERAEVDHAQIATAALAALGDDEAPTDLALRLDHRIEHLLVDEFQDTSSLQFELLRRLTRGWAEHAEADPERPRTLLVVGDPMQSIYGFREANVGLFIQARDEGIGELHLEPLELQVNFRSTQSLVAWSNRHFARAFPRRDAPELGAVAFQPAAAARGAGAEPELALFYGEGAQDAEAAALCDAVAAGLEDPHTHSMAILGRSRNQLRPFLAALRERGIAYAARDFDPLGTRPVVRDLVTLTSVLLDPLDRFAWLSLLRTPPVALDAADLLTMALEAPVAAALGDGAPPAALSGLSRAGSERVRHLAAVVAWAEHYRDRLATRVWVEETWLRLGGAGTLADAATIADAREFFRLLESLEQSPAGFTVADLREALDTLYASPGDDQCPVQVMTLHKAKGLEFDRVFIPALDRGTRRSDSDLLLWDEIALPGQAATVLLDVRDAVGGKAQGRLYDFLSRQQERKREYEATRLLYVGCTRAVNHLWLSASLSESRDGDGYSPPRRGSLLAHLWPTLDADPPATRADLAPEDAEATLPYVRLTAVPSVEALPDPVAADARGIESSDNREARALGTAVHRVLESLAWHTELPRRCDARLQALLRVALTEAGCGRDELEARTAEGTAILDRSLADTWLRWALDPARAERRAEVPLTLAGDGDPRALVLDYVFRDEAAREYWIVDYKTSSPAGGECPEGFIEREAERYRAQLEGYREALSHLVEERVRCALYFTGLARHLEVAPPR